MKYFNLVVVVLLIIAAAKEGFSRIDLSGEFSYSKQVFGSGKSNALRTRAYNASVAYYFYNLTAFEVTYIYDETITTEQVNSKITGSDYTWLSSESKLISEVVSVGLRQAFAGAKARFRPTLSLGYAYRMYKDINSYQIRNDTNSSIITGLSQSPLSKQNSFFASLGLQFRLMGRFYLRGSVQTVFPFFRPSLAGDYLKYTAGFLWSF